MSAELPRRRPATDRERRELARAITGAQRTAARRLDYAARARLLLAARRRSRELFGDAILPEPAIDILLDLFLHYPADRPIDDVCGAVGDVARRTTVSRYIGHLQDSGLVRRTADPLDAELCISLTPSGRDRLETYLDDPFGLAIPGSGRPADDDDNVA